MPSLRDVQVAGAYDAKHRLILESGPDALAHMTGRQLRVYLNEKWIYHRTHDFGQVRGRPRRLWERSFLRQYTRASPFRDDVSQ